MTDRKPQDQDRYIVRFPDGMREQLKKLAADNGRSLNAEIIHRLEQSLAGVQNQPLPGNPDNAIQQEAFETVAKFGYYLNSVESKLDRLLGKPRHSDRFQNVPTAPELPASQRSQLVELTPDQLAKLSEDLKAHFQTILSEQFSPSPDDPDEPPPTVPKSSSGGGSSVFDKATPGRFRQVKLHHRGK